MEFNALFNVKKPTIGMIHLAGSNKSERVRRALEELTIYEREGINGAIIEDYHGNFEDVENVVVWNMLEKQWLNVPVGHWIIRGRRGELYSCEPKVFEKTYESCKIESPEEINRQ